MDGRTKKLRALLIAFMAIQCERSFVIADDFIRPPAKTSVKVSSVQQPAPSTAPASSSTQIVAPSRHVNTDSVTSRVELRPEPIPTTGRVPTSNERRSYSMPVTGNGGTRTSTSRPAGSMSLTSNESASSDRTQWQPRDGRPAVSVQSLGSNRRSTVYAPGSNDLMLGSGDGKFEPVFADPVSDPPIEPRPVQSGNERSGYVVPVAEPSAREMEEMNAIQARKELAAKISKELQSPTNDKTNHWAMNLANSSEQAPGWQAVGEELAIRLKRCEELLQRRAYLSAMEESNRAIIYLSRVIDLRQNSFLSEPSWANAQQAFREAREFTSVERIANDPERFTRFINSHETPVLHGADLKGLTPFAALQSYHEFAMHSLVDASQGHPWFSELYYCIGRTLQAESESGTAQSDTLLREALVYFRAAQEISPGNATNSNQLGYVLLKMDRPSEAMTQLSHTVRMKDCPLEAWQNLVQASQRLGDKQTEQWARQSYVALKSRGALPSGPTGTMIEVNPQQFAAMSPYGSGPRAPMDFVSATQGQQNAQMMGAPGMPPAQGAPMMPNQQPNMNPGAPVAPNNSRTAGLPILNIFR